MMRWVLGLLALLAPAAAMAAAPPASVPATVVVAFDQDRIAPLIAEGTRNRDGAAPVQPNDPVRIASISKLIMALAALKLVDEGKLDLDRDVSDYLGWKLRSPYHPHQPVTLRHLMMHRAGLSDAAGYSIPLGASLEAKLADAGSWRNVAQPGDAAFEYANLGSPVVATVLEAVSGERYDRLLERLVFAPLDIEACLVWTGCDAEARARAVTLYRHTGEVARDAPGELTPDCPVPVAEGTRCDLDSYVPGTNASIFGPQGSVRIGMTDLAKIGQALRRKDERIVSARGLAAINQSLLDSQNEGQEFFCFYGLHLQVIDVPEIDCSGLFTDGAFRIGHSGEAYGLLSGLWIGDGDALGFAYFTTENPPPPGGEDTGGFTAREKALMARAAALVAK